MMRTFLALLMLPAFAALTPLPASARCAPSGLELYLMNGTDHSLAADGALIVGIRPGPRRARGRAAGFPELSLSQGRTSIPLRLEPLSAFMARYVPETTPAPGRYRIGGLDNALVRFEARTSGTALSAPVVRAVQRREQRQRRAGVRTQVRVVFGSPLPVGAIAAVVDSERGGFGGGAVPESAPAEGAGGLSVYDWGRRCQQRPRSLRAPPPAGAAVRVRLIDRDGQLGAPATVSMTGG